MQKYNRKLLIITFFLLTVLLIVGCSSNVAETNESSEELEKDLNIAFPAQPPILDPHITTAVQALEIARNIFETLVTVNEDYEPVPMLADSIESSKDGKTYTFHLREGVQFHNGEEMKSDDVEASMNRWLEKASVATTFLRGAKFESQGPYTVVLHLENRASDVLDILAGRSQFPAIMPKEIIETATETGVDDIIGTGPFKLMEWRQDQYIHLAKFENYVAVDSEPSGLSGKKEVFFDNVYFRVVVDPSTRLAGISTGEYDIATTLPNDSYDQLIDMPDVDVYFDYAGTNNIYYNRREGVMSDRVMRQAVNLALDMEQIMLASFTNEDLYDLDHNYMNPEQENWASTAGSESYNQSDIDKAKDLLEEANYNGEEIIILTSRAYDEQYNAAVVVEEQLKQIGMNAKLEEYDWTAYQDRRKDTSLWDIVTVGGQGLLTAPSQLLALDTVFAGGEEDARLGELVEIMRTSETQEETKAHWDTLQGYLWNDYVPITIFGHHSFIYASTEDLEGFTLLQGPILWNAKITK